MTKKKKIEIVIDEDGNASIDIIGGVGASCKKDADEWSAIFGGGAKVTKKPEFYRQANKNDVNVQTGG
jgi:hypothetical protein